MKRGRGSGEKSKGLEEGQRGREKDREGRKRDRGFEVRAGSRGGREEEEKSWYGELEHRLGKEVQRNRE